MNNYVNKHNKPIFFFIFGTIASLVLTLVGGLLFKSANWGTIAFSFTVGVTLVWYIILAVTGSFKGSGNTKQNAPQSVQASSLQDDDGWE